LQNTETENRAGDGVSIRHRFQLWRCDCILRGCQSAGQWIRINICIGLKSKDGSIDDIEVGRLCAPAYTHTIPRKQSPNILRSLFASHPVALYLNNLPDHSVTAMLKFAGSGTEEEKDQGSQRCKMHHSTKSTPRTSPNLGNSYIPAFPMNLNPQTQRHAQHQIQHLTLIPSFSSSSYPGHRPITASLNPSIDRYTHKNGT